MDARLIKMKQEACIVPKGNVPIYIYEEVISSTSGTFLQKTSRKRAENKQKCSETPPSSGFLHPDVAVLYIRMSGTATPGCRE
ncbi:hypothetical protein [uncultured Parabacteroides sp.]|uniref:hypothetical protein n=1 Tax=Parabacteroides sp. ASD2025 TaxID=3415987 RepID=UPI00265A1B1B|nr:hypothetical protein [uncultured Parabacteroides sp.]